MCDTATCYGYNAGSNPHRLASITGTYLGVTNPNFAYDANGNMTCIYATGQACDAQHAARYMSWTSFNMVSQTCRARPRLRSSTGPSISG